MGTVNQHIESLPTKWRSDDGQLVITRANTEHQSWWVQSGRLCVWADSLQVQTESDDPAINELVIDGGTSLEISFAEANDIRKFIAKA